MKAVSVFFGVLFFSVFCLIGVDTASALQPPLWSDGNPTMLQKVAETTYQDPVCGTYAQDAFVVEQKATRSACIYGDDRLKIGFFSAGGPYIGVVGFPYSNDMHVLEGVCGGTPCRYSAQSDIVATNQSISQSSVGVVLFKHASSRIHRVPQPNGTVKYVFDASNPDYSLKNDSGRYIWTPSYALSLNGKWLVVELREAGIALINTTTHEQRQLTTVGYRYGFGMDPALQLAVSDDGKSVVVAGPGAGARIIDVIPDCGQDLLGQLTLQPGHNDCPSIDISFAPNFPNFWYAERPVFIGDGHQLELKTHSWRDGDHRVVYGIQGSTMSHRIQLLAMGDSFTSGEGETDKGYYFIGTNTDFDNCHTSKRAYPLLVSARLGLGSNDARSIACAGAKISDIIGSADDYWGQDRRLFTGGFASTVSQKTELQSAAVETFQPGRALQSDFLERYNPQKIIIGIGGNDAGLMGKLKTCAMPGTCEWAVGNGIKSTASEIKQLFAKLGGLFSYIQLRYPESKVYVAGYPNFIDPEGACDRTTAFLLDHAERVFIESAVHYLNQIIHAATDAAGYTYLDIEDSMKGKELCSGAAPAAMNGLKPGSDIAPISAIPILKLISAGTFHPTPTGHALIAEKILSGQTDLGTALPTPQLPKVSSQVVSTEAPTYWGLEGQDTSGIFSVSRFAEPVKEDPKSFSISVPAGVFEPGAKVKVELHSALTELATLTAGEDGTLIGAIHLPDTLEDGYHTLHLIGYTRELKDIDLYQFLTVGSNEDFVPQDSLPGGITLFGSPSATPTNSSPNEKTTHLDTIKSGISSLIPSVIGATHSKDVVKQPLGLIEYIWVGPVAATFAILVLVICVLLCRRWAKPSS